MTRRWYDMFWLGLLLLHGHEAAHAVYIVEHSFGGDSLFSPLETRPTAVPPERNETTEMPDHCIKHLLSDRFLFLECFQKLCLVWTTLELLPVIT